MACKAMHDLAPAYLCSIIYHYPPVLTPDYSSHVNPQFILTLGT